MFLGLWGFALSNNLHNLQVQAAVPDCPSDSLSDQSILMHLFDGLLPIITLDCIRSISNVAAGLYFSVSVFQGPITGLWCVIVPVCLFKLVMLICLHTVHLWRRSRGPVLSSPCIPRLQQLQQSCSQLFPLGFSRGAGWQLGGGGFCRDVCMPGAWRGAGGEGAEAAQPSLVCQGGIAKWFSGVLAFDFGTSVTSSVQGRLLLLVLGLLPLRCSQQWEQDLKKAWLNKSRF